MAIKELDKILEKHSKWLRNEVGGECANLVDTDLQGADLHGADLRNADLSGADLQWTNLFGANFQGANFFGANFQGANFFGANFQGADLQCANLQGAGLRGANLQGADLRGANLTGVKAFGTILNLQCPEEGSFIAWKKLRYGAVAKLLIPENAKRSSATSRKCRASKAVVLEIYNENGEEISEGSSINDYEFIYRVGETIYPDHWDEDRWNECSNGIHFFITRREAEEY